MMAGARVDSCELITVVKVTFPRGAGVDGDPVRLIIQYWTPEGTMLAEVDTWKDGQ